VAGDLAVGQEETEAQAIDADVVANGEEILSALFYQRADQVLRHAAEAESTDH
jgi:hypothetical protein